VRVDVRGSGDSDGLPMDEYARQEQLDGVDVIAWIAAQPWCSGCGRHGRHLMERHKRTPDSGRATEPLKAIITHCSTDDRYEDDAHTRAGCVLHDMLVWATLFRAFQGHSARSRKSWVSVLARRWYERLRAIDFNLGSWLEHQSKDPWKHGSVRENYSKITCAVYAIGGWAMAYKNAVFRLLRDLRAHEKA